MNANDQKINAQYQTLLVIWVSLTISQFLFVLLTFFVKPQLFRLDASKPLLGSQPIMVIALGAA